jgi:CheY-like chemotaxis protein
MRAVVIDYPRKSARREAPRRVSANLGLSIATFHLHRAIRPSARLLVRQDKGRQPQMSRILVVDEDPIGRRATAAILRELQCTVRFAPDAHAGLRVLHRAPFDAVLVSASLPEMSAAAFVDEVRHDEPTADVPVFVVAVSPRSSVDAIRIGARGCIRDPVDAGGIMSALSTVLRPWNAHRPSARGSAN